MIYRHNNHNYVHVIEMKKRKYLKKLILLNKFENN